ncbi:MAG: phage tail assembly protein [Bacillota bacterium]
MSFQTEYEFELPKGYIDKDGNIHKRGIMRLATAADEIQPLKDPRVQQNPAYLTIVLLARVVNKLGDLSVVDTATMEGLYKTDLAYLQDLYQRINSTEAPVYHGICPHCKKDIDVPIDFFKM